MFAGARNPSTATELQALARAYPGKIHPIALVSCDQETHAAAVEEIKKVAGRLDVVVANAGKLSSSAIHLPMFMNLSPLGIFDAYASILETTPDEMRTHFDVSGSLFRDRLHF